jgi:hypothetical protein
MSTTTARSDTIEALVQRIKETLPAEVYHLSADPYEGADGNLHLAVIADVTDGELRAARPAIAEAVEAANIELGFEPLVVFHTGQPHCQLARVAREEGVRL